MTPDIFNQTVLPRIKSATANRCLCDHPGFRKLLSFNFEDYKTGPMALADTEIIGAAIIQQQFEQYTEPQDLQGVITQQFKCPQCGAICEEIYTEYSINMRRSWYRFIDDKPLSAVGKYLIGFFGFSDTYFNKVNDYESTNSIDVFLQSIGIADKSS